MPQTHEILESLDSSIPLVTSARLRALEGNLFRYDPVAGPVLRVTQLGETVTTEVVENGQLTFAVADARQNVKLVTRRFAVGEVLQFHRSMHHFYGEEPMSPKGRKGNKFNSLFRNWLFLAGHLFETIHSSKQGRLPRNAQTYTYQFGMVYSRV